MQPKPTKTRHHTLLAALLALAIPSLIHAADPPPPSTQPAAPAQPAAPDKKPAAPQHTPGQLVSALINDQWTKATVIEEKDGKFTVIAAYRDWADEIYPYSSVKVGHQQNPPPDSLKPGQSIQVFWGNQYWPARVVSTSPDSLVIRWDQTGAAPIDLPIQSIQPLPQPVPKPGKTDKPTEPPAKYDLV